MRRLLLPLLALALFPASIFAQYQPMKVFAYINRYAPEAVRQMEQYRIPASVTLAQAIFESSCGSSPLARRSNNHFGIKCHGGWEGDTIAMTDDVEDECFRKYSAPRQSYRDHSLFLVSRPRYAFLFSLPLTDYRGWCKGLKQAGYATYPTYADELIRIIETNRLYLLDGPVKLVAKTLQPRMPSALLPSPAMPAAASVADFAEYGLLWLHEKDVLMQSLDLVTAADEETGVAGN